MAYRVGPALQEGFSELDYVQVYDGNMLVAIIYGRNADDATHRARQFIAAADLLPELAEWFTEFRDELIADQYNDSAIDDFIARLSPFADEPA